MRAAHTIARGLARGSVFTAPTARANAVGATRCASALSGKSVHKAAMFDRPMVEDVLDVARQMHAEPRNGHLKRFRGLLEGCVMVRARGSTMPQVSPACRRCGLRVCRTPTPPSTRPARAWCAWSCVVQWYACVRQLLARSLLPVAAASAFWAQLLETALTHARSAVGVMTPHPQGLVFAEPSTRTMQSFNMAMQRLGGSTFVVDAATSSRKKGETMHDTVK